ncbi:uroporphyrinogen-III synthase [Pseudoxanthomonas broegbernensis]|uniref:Uroporphyrinogen-III synthase n=1 Tax=Pseudoxanthomonas broegbernensis TaxID=83619 RepID=A0A7V8K7E6_9GAMM|nr:uroporphyrinogen-III synthase [Pseudoxanthomonas broegbernensis]KAF1686976.1 uroporphyrinogen-III synthase [Pseudoxanthomonas broegbernensis]MBB6065413.1 uroporphyrinogen-III synthase [Pseudoxanthomonas broegbernensis]
MPTPRPPAWILVSLRPRGGHEALRRAAARHGAGLLALSPWALRPREDAASRQALDAALDAQALVFTSPAAVRAAARLRPLRERRGQHWLAVGAGSAAALRRAGIAAVRAPARMDSEGLLALPELDGISSVGLVTAPGGRGMIPAILAARGAQVHRADVYDRVPLPPGAAALERLRGLDRPAVLALSSEQALRLVLEQWPAAAATALRRCAVAAASERLARIAAGYALGPVAVAGDPRPAALAATAHALIAAA